MMWTCTKCSYAYNKVEENKCEVCRVSRQIQKEDSAGPENGDFQLHTKVRTIYIFPFLLLRIRISTDF